MIQWLIQSARPIRKLFRHRWYQPRGRVAYCAQIKSPPYDMRSRYLSATDRGILQIRWKYQLRIWGGRLMMLIDVCQRKSFGMQWGWADSSGTPATFLWPECGLLDEGQEKEDDLTFVWRASHPFVRQFSASCFIGTEPILCSEWYIMNKWHREMHRLHWATSGLPNWMVNVKLWYSKIMLRSPLKIQSNRFACSGSGGLQVCPRGWPSTGCCLYQNAAPTRRFPYAVV